MVTVLDHTIVPVRDRQEAVKFYTEIFGFEDLGEAGPFLAVRVNDTLNLDFRRSDDFRSIHYAFAMEANEFERPSLEFAAPVFATVTAPRSRKHEGPRMTLGAKGQGKAVYFKDPSGHILEIKTY